MCIYIICIYIYSYIYIYIYMCASSLPLFFFHFISWPPTSSILLPTHHNSKSQPHGGNIHQSFDLSVNPHLPPSSIPLN